VVLFAPEIDEDQQYVTQRSLYDRSRYDAYKRLVIGGAWVMWPNVEAYARKEPGTIEYIAAGKGFGPSILQLTADVAERSVRSGRTWTASKRLFDRYGGIVHPSGNAVRFKPTVYKDQRYAPGVLTIRRCASSAFNAGDNAAGILPRYQFGAHSTVEDLVQLDADTQLSEARQDRNAPNMLP
jgi:hypothetical protein